MLDSKHGFLRHDKMVCSHSACDGLRIHNPSAPSHRRVDSAHPHLDQGHVKEDSSVLR